jgi:tRNA-Thr(GGU) m(6)t(6)A37 methyltransferase TsaA
MHDQTYQIRSIGHVQANEHGFALHIAEPYRAGLKELGQFSHVKVYWWADQCDTAEGRATVQVEPPYAKGQIVGVFACGSPARPNPLAATTCFVLGVDEAAGVVQVPWIDAFDGTPLIDLKPYVPVADRAREVYGPAWFAPLPQWLDDGADIPPGFFGDE